MHMPHAQQEVKNEHIQAVLGPPDQMLCRFSLFCSSKRLNNKPFLRKLSSCEYYFFLLKS